MHRSTTLRPTAPSKVYTCHTCGHEGPYVVADECHSCWMRRINKEPELDSLLPENDGKGPNWTPMEMSPHGDD